MSWIECRKVHRAVALGTAKSLVLWLMFTGVGCGTTTGPFPADDVEVDGEVGATDDADPDVVTPEDVDPDVVDPDTDRDADVEVDADADAHVIDGDVDSGDVVDADVDEDVDTDVDEDVDADASDDGDTSPPDEDLNACGTVGELPVTIDDPCGVCGDGLWSCEDEDDADDVGEGIAGVICLDPTLPNACGGCATLDASPGATCDVDGATGMTVCVGTESVACVAGASNMCGGTQVLMLDGEAVEPGDPCALQCGAGVVACDGDDAVVCVDDGTSVPPNACGGCGLLAGVPGDACGECARWTCDSGVASCTSTTTIPGCGTGQTCATLDCGAENRSCTEGSDGSDAVCGACLEGYDERGGACVLVATCAALNCGAANRSCTEGVGGADATCDDCLEGHLEDGGACRAIVTCGDLVCETLHRSCTAETHEADAVCGDCVTGLVDESGICVRPLAAACDDTIPCGDGLWCPTETYVQHRRCAPLVAYGGQEMPFQYIPAGMFVMGSPAEEIGRGENEDREWTTVSRPVFMQRTELTQGQWREVMDAHNAAYGTSYGVAPSYFGRPGTGMRCIDDACPVERVSWYDALTYANALSRLEGLEPCYTLSGCQQIGDAGSGACSGGGETCDSSGYACDLVTFAGASCTGYRLPTEAEWEHAARAGTLTANYIGDVPDELTGCDQDQPRSIAWYCGMGESRTRQVGLLTPNVWGLYDMLGNVDELTWNHYAASHEGGTDPLGPATGTNRAVRGGNWGNGARTMRTARRSSRPPSGRYSYIGLRLVRTVPTQCAVDADCDDGEWCPTDTVFSMCAPRPVVGGVAMPFQYVPPGSFLIGSPEGEVGRSNHREGQVSVTIPHGVYMGRTEVTQGQWSAVMVAWNALSDDERTMSGWEGATPLFGTRPSYGWQSDMCYYSDCPVERVNWWDVVVYANALSILEGLEPCYTLSACSAMPTNRLVGGGCEGALSCSSNFLCADVTFTNFACTGYRLPSEAEWEFAARGATPSATYLGALSGRVTGCSNAQANLDPIAWWCIHHGYRLHFVGEKEPNDWGLYDMLGNAWEWTWSWYADEHVSDPFGPASGSSRVLRGGSAEDDAGSARAASRLDSNPMRRWSRDGFRLARTATEP